MNQNCIDINNEQIQQKKNEEELTQNNLESTKIFDTLKELSKTKHNPLFTEKQINYYLKNAGCDCRDQNTRRYISLATHYFIHSIVKETYEYEKHKLMAEGKYKEVPSLKMEMLREVIKNSKIDLS